MKIDRLLLVILIVLYLSPSRQAKGDPQYRREGEPVTFDWVCDYGESKGMWIIFTENTGWGMNMSESDYARKCAR